MEANENDVKVKLIRSINEIMTNEYPDSKYEIKLEQGLSNVNGDEKDAIRITIVSQN